MIRYADSDEDVIEIHRFLCIVAQPVLFCQIDAERSIREVNRVVYDEMALMAELGGHLIGTIGIIRVPWWYGTEDDEFLTDRWFFVLPQFYHTGVGGRLEAEAQVVAQSSGLDLIITGKLMRRQNGIVFTRPNVTRHGK